ncbi:MAG: ferrous iron transport protein B [Syntrophorhabdaceae bacterium]|nr:ferrous iron transport protein B [Syntrophorhabdaceae bacterium]
MDTEHIPITSFEEGEEGVVYEITGGEGLITRLAGMGIIPGIRIKVLRNIRGLVIVLASDTRIALGKGQAGHILAKKSPPPQKDEEEIKKEKKTILVALAGQPNVGKSTVFNMLTGLSQHVGNWPGKTVEKIEGIHETEEMEMRIVDLPGTYSLSAFSEEERVARDFIIHEHPDVIVLLVNASALERSLYLLSELLILGPPVIVAVNMIDVAESQGVRIDIDMLQNSLQLPVVEMIATKNRGIKELILTIQRLVNGELRYNPKIPEVSPDHRHIYDRIIELLGEHASPPHPDVWLAVKLMEGDSEAIKEMKELLPEKTWNEINLLLSKHEDALRAVVGGRYDWIERITRASVSRFKMGQVLITDRIDHALTRPIIGVPFLLAILAFVFFLTFKLGYPVQKWLESRMGDIARFIELNLSGIPLWFKGLLLDGIIGGAGSVLVLVPILFIFFSAMSFLEDVGYMSRAAFVMDRFMHIIGLHGKSFLPLCLGFGCNVPSIMGSRIIESKRARLLTIMLIPFVPCTARMASVTFIAASVFGEKGGVVAWALIALNLIALGLTGMVMNRLFFKNEPVPFILELPLYHKPNLKTIWIEVWTRVWLFIKKAGTIILGVSVIVWALSNFPGESIESSILGRLGHAIEPLGAPLGLDWKMIVALLASIMAKENSIATLGVLYNVGETGLVNVLSETISHASSLSFLVTLMLFIPCVSTIAVMKQEMNDKRWFAGVFIFTLALSYGGGALAYRIALLFGL